MSLNGHLSTVPIPDLLQWLHEGRQTGILSVERGGECKKVFFRNGQLIGAASDEPATRLGQVLLARGHITAEQLSQALAKQETIRKDLGSILVEMGALNAEVLIAALKAKSEEVIYSLFDWDEAIFSFDTETPMTNYVHELRIDLQGTLMKGVQRFDEMKQFRKVFSDMGIVLASTGVKPPPKIRESKISNQIFQFIDGKRTLAEILLHARSSEYLVMKFLFELHKRNLIKITEIQPIPDHLNTEHESSVVGNIPAVNRDETETELDNELRVVQWLEDQGEHRTALELLHAFERHRPGEPRIREYLQKAEAEFIREHSRLDSSLVPVLTPKSSTEDWKKHLSPEANFLPTMIDGKNDVQSIIWLAPIRAIDVMKSLKQLVDLGVVEMMKPEQIIQAS